MGLTLTIRVEYEGKTSKEDFGVQQRFPLEQFMDAKTDIVCPTIYNLVDMINKALKERHAGRPGANA
jgi:hypothetical protein